MDKGEKRLAEKLLYTSACYLYRQALGPPRMASVFGSTQNRGRIKTFIDACPMTVGQIEICQASPLDAIRLREINEKQARSLATRLVKGMNLSISSMRI